ncbi:CPBP family intramembrane glutamic endopeptidase [Cyanobium sp. NIES-981]|uniref:CPBP family intramembrane glutamic endopeptidase n=1 Tax=Cyanobium sp. NIES-981 TaxID=1851505 RepID=UPI0007DE171D|nr:CPBP family intramembrane glutamic endopeptidase [Cyanobium sp. NIES-981]SBO42532.1 Caax amino terminal protease family protein [Cyanobium sp. NIES-981]
MNVRGPRPPAWKTLLALLSLSLSALLWVNALLQSLEEPTVVGALDRRQLELTALAAPAVPARLRELLTGAEPLEALRDSLAEQLADSDGPGQPEELLQLALLQSQAGESAGAAQLWRRLQQQIPPEQRALVGALERAEPLAPELLQTLQQPWLLSPLNERLVCERLSAAPGPCGGGSEARRALWRLLGVSWVPGVLLLVGLGLLLRQAWIRIRGLAPSPPPLQGPPLDLVDVTLLIAGGFVLLGELSVPLLLAPAVQALLRPLAQEPALQQGLQVLLLYLALMAAPLAILWGQLRTSPAAAPAAGWLQWRWTPLGTSVQLALQQVLMLLPAVALVGWLTSQLFGNQGGSNPLLELVLTTDQPLALGCFALTAVVLAPLFEETLFRGVLLPVLGQRWGGSTAVVVSAGVFAAAHLSLNELAPLLVLGLGLGWLRLQGGRLGSCTLVHALWNGFTFTNLLLLAG